MKKKSYDKSSVIKHSPHSSSRNMHNHLTHIFVLFFRNYGPSLPPIQGRMVTPPWPQAQALNPRLVGARRLITEIHATSPITSPPTNQKIVTSPVVITPNFAYKNFFSQTMRSLWCFSMSHPFSLLDREINISLLQTRTFLFIWPRYALGMYILFNNKFK